MNNSYLKIDLKKQVTFLFFLISFPFNFFYNYGLVEGWLPQIPGLGYSTFQHLLVPILLIYSLPYIKKKFTKKYFFVFLSYCTITVIISLIGHIFVSHNYGNEPLYQSLWTIIYIYVYTFFALFMFEKNIGRGKIFFYFLIAYFGIAAINIQPNSTILFSLDRIAGTHLGHINYQIVSFIFLITWFFYYFSNNSTLSKRVSVTILLFLLIVSGGRSELFGFLFAYAYIAIINIKNKTFKLRSLSAYLIIAIILIVMILATIDLELLLEPFQKSRHLEVNNLSNSSSWIARQQLFQSNLSYIFNNPVLGSFGSHFEIGKGSYIHNILSVWQQYGILAFIMYLILVFTPFIHLTYLKFKSHKNSLFMDAALFLATYSLLLVFVSKSAFWDYLGLSIGTYLYYLYSSKKSVLYEQ